MKMVEKFAKFFRADSSRDYEKELKYEPVFDYFMSPTDDNREGFQIEDEARDEEQQNQREINREVHIERDDCNNHKELQSEDDSCEQLRGKGDNQVCII